MVAQVLKKVENGSRFFVNILCCVIVAYVRYNVEYSTFLYFKRKLKILNKKSDGVDLEFLAFQYVSFKENV